MIASSPSREGEDVSVGADVLDGPCGDSTSKEREDAAPAPVEGNGPAIDLDWITPSLAVGGAFDADAVPRLVEAGVCAVVDLRSEGRDDEGLLAANAIGFLHLPTEDHHAVSQAMLDAGVAFVLDRVWRGGRVLLHCREGIGRSVTLMLCVLAAQDVEPLAAMFRIKDRRYYASPSPAQFEAWAQWLRRRGLQPPDFADFASVAYRHLAS